MARRLASLALAMAVVAARMAGAAGGDVDATFGTAGFVSHVIDDHDVDPPHGDDRWHMARGADGRIVVGRSWYDGTSGTPAIDLRRFLADGTVDTSFGTGGLVRFGPIGGGGLVDLVVQPDHKVVLLLSGTLRRFDVSGAPDSSFGTAGEATIVGPAEDVALQPDGKLLTSRWTCDATPVPMCTATVRRYLADGSPDTFFGAGGTATPVTTGFTSGTARLGLQSDGGIIGTCGNGVFRFFADGTRDTTFGTSGLSPLAMGATDLAVLPDDRVVVLTADNFSMLAVVRLTATGASDATFGTSGTSAVGILSYLYPTRLLAGSDGTLTVLSLPPFAGALYDPGQVTRFGPDGTLDMAFAPCGHAIPAGLPIDDGALLPDGRVLLTGVYPLDQVFVAPQEWLRFARLGTPDSGTCKTATPGTVVAKAKLAGGYNTTRARWRIGVGTVFPSELGDPTAGSGYSYCVVEPGDTPPAVRASLAIPGGVSCSGRPCWKRSGLLSYRYVSRARFAPKLTLRSGDPGKAQIKLKAYVTLPPQRPLTLRIDRTDGPGCWEATLPAG